TLRIPRTGTFDMPAVAAGYMVVAIAIADIDQDVDTVTWNATTPQGTTSQAFHVGSSKYVADSPICRTQLWALSRPQAGPGFVDVSRTGGSASLAGAIITFSNVGTTSTGGTCC